MSSSGNSDSNGYVVGYRRPPLHSRFRAGQSGNPAGRRKGVRNLMTDVKRTLGRPIKVKEGGRTRTKSTQKGALMVLREKALRGDARALDRLLELALRFNNDAGEIGTQPVSPDDQAILAAYVAELTAAASRNPGPAPATTSDKKDPKSAFLESSLGLAAAHSIDGAVHFVCMDWRHCPELHTAGDRVYSELLNLCVWVKPNGGLGSLYRSQHELGFVFKKGRAAPINNVALGRYGRSRTNVWTYAGMNSFGSGRDQALAAHPTVKPVAMVRDAILDCSKRGGIVLDAFVGSGTTLLAAHRTGRRGYGLEIDPAYVDLALRRFRGLTGIEPMHSGTGLTLAQLESENREALAASHPIANNGGAESIS
jgi:hypothetical protein